MQVYKTYKDLFNTVCGLGRGVRGWNKQNNFLLQFDWRVTENVSIQYSIYPSKSGIEEENRFQFILEINHSLFVYRKREVLFNGTYNELTCTADPHTLIMRYAAENWDENEQFSHVGLHRALTLGYFVAYRSGYTFENFKNYFKEKKGHADISFFYNLGSILVDEPDEESVLVMYNMEMCCSKTRVSITYYTHPFDSEADLWYVNEGVSLDGENAPIEFLYESTDVWELMFVVEPDSNWRKEECSYLKKLVKRNL